MKANGTAPHDDQFIKMLCSAKYAFITWLTNIICFKEIPLLNSKKFTLLI